jgi:hypothetical protein
MPHPCVRLPHPLRSRPTFLRKARDTGQLGFRWWSLCPSESGSALPRKPYGKPDAVILLELPGFVGWWLSDQGGPGGSEPRARGHAQPSPALRAHDAAAGS